MYRLKFREKYIWETEEQTALEKVFLNEEKKDPGLQEEEEEEEEEETEECMLSHK